VPLHQQPVGGRGHQQLRLGVGQVAGQLLAPVGGVAADDHGAGQGGPAHPEHELRHVVHEQRHVERARATEREQEGGALGLGPDDLGVGPGAVGEGQADPVVALTVADQLLDRVQRSPWVVVRRSSRRRVAVIVAGVGPRHKSGTRCNSPDPLLPCGHVRPVGAGTSA